MENTIAGVVVLYNPEAEIFERNIPSYLPYIDVLYIVDNSEGKTTLPEEYVYAKNIVYMPFGENRGIATALNTGAAKAIQNRYEWLLTMDQDSWFKPEDIKTLINSAQHINKDETAILTPVHVQDEIAHGARRNALEEKAMAMTSGNLVNLDVYTKIGGFNEGYFIDLVDHEYCLKARKNGYKIIEVCNSFLEHSLGRARIVKLLFKKRAVIEHNPVRKYYQVRNLLYLKNEYFGFRNEIKFLVKHEIIALIKIILFEKKIGLKLKMMYHGLTDYRKNIKGKLNQ
jgi:rhamnosyltransferase